MTTLHHDSIEIRIPAISKNDAEENLRAIYYELISLMRTNKTGTPDDYYYLFELLLHLVPEYCTE